MGIFSKKPPTDAELAANVRQAAINYVWAKYNDEPQTDPGGRVRCREDFAKAVSAVAKRIEGAADLSEEIRPLAEIFGAETRVPYMSDTWLDVTAEAVAHPQVINGNPFAKFVPGQTI